MKNDFPIIKNLKDYGFYDQLSGDELNYVLSGIFEQPVKKYINNIINENGNVIYRESNGYWEKYKYDEYGNKIYYEDSDGRIIYSENSDTKKTLYNRL